MVRCPDHDEQYSGRRLEPDEVAPFPESPARCTLPPSTGADHDRSAPARTSPTPRSTIATGEGRVHPRRTARAGLPTRARSCELLSHRRPADRGTRSADVAAMARGAMASTTAKA